MAIKGQGGREECCLDKDKCKMQFQAIETVTSQLLGEDNTDDGVKEKVTKSIFYCDYCGFIEQVDFED